MNKYYAILCVCIGFALGVLVSRSAPHAVIAATMTQTSPTQGWTLHVDAQKHFGDAHPTEVAHHWCKPVSGGLTECQIYNSDAADAQLVAVETIVTPATYNSFASSEQAMWHYHKTEIPKVNISFPGMSPDEAKKTVAAMSDTYGKVWVLYDPMATNGQPVGQPSVTIVK